ncbi:MAG: YbaB/EbfC family nucleoid-associated protein [Micavibrio aeruginosavorus]|uniref:Nucleoid-associated protein DI551_01995 n=1 Tax=Micavibrio aeruginosavorus TaxID=349221 RepID=A0A2W5N435_9BACT|nr:MAG: YbaB/EbfC family nucleoid-associated protein [Micavibrio aeruginosavorus]
MNIMKMMSQAKAMQEKMQAMQEKMGDELVEGVSGGGLVKVTLSCKGQCKSISLDDSVVIASDKEVLEDLLKAAINDAKAKADSKMADETQKMMSDLGLPAGALGGMGGLPF